MSADILEEAKTEIKLKYILKHNKLSFVRYLLKSNVPLSWYYKDAEQNYFINTIRLKFENCSNDMFDKTNDANRYFIENIALKNKIFQQIVANFFEAIHI